MTGGEWPIWITALATVITAILTGTGGLAAWLALSRERSKELPIIERAYSWEDGHLVLRLTVRNRLPETIVLARVAVTAPRGMMITDEYGPRTGFGSPGPPIRGTRRHRECAYEVRPLGSTWSDLTGGDSGYFTFELWPPSEWSSGKVTIDLRISSKADTMRNRRVVVTNVVTAPKSKSTD